LVINVGELGMYLSTQIDRYLSIIPNDDTSVGKRECLYYLQSSTKIFRI
jgi:hypothetical protein